MFWIDRLLLVLGEALRRGFHVARLAQIGLLALICLGGVATLAALLTGHGGRGTILSLLIELTWGPWLLWRLLLTPTAGWFHRVRGHGSTTRTSGRWLPVLIAWGVTWGTMVAWSQSW